MLHRGRDKTGGGIAFAGDRRLFLLASRRFPPISSRKDSTPPDGSRATGLSGRGVHSARAARSHATQTLRHLSSASAAPAAGWHYVTPFASAREGREYLARGECEAATGKWQKTKGERWVGHLQKAPIPVIYIAGSAGSQKTQMLSLIVGYGG